MIKRILVPLDGSDLAEEAIGVAAGIARASKATIDLFMVHEPFMVAGADDDWSERQIVAERKYLEQLADELLTGASVASNQTLMRGSAPELIATRAADCDADLVVMTSHGRNGWTRAWLGSVADAVMRSSNVPVLMVRPAEQRKNRRAIQRSFRRILVPVDGSPESLEVFGSVSGLATALGASVDLTRVVAPVPMITTEIAMPFLYLPNFTDSEATEGLVAQVKAELERDAERLRRHDVSVGERTVLVSEHTAKAIVSFAKGHETDLIAMTTHGRGRSRLVLGSVAEKVRHATELPVLVYRPRFARMHHPKLSSENIVSQLPALAGNAGKS